MMYNKCIEATGGGVGGVFEVNAKTSLWNSEHGLGSDAGGHNVVKLRREAAHNLVRMFAASGSAELGRMVME